MLSPQREDRAWVWRYVRTLRARPPKELDDERRAVYAAALGQSEELILSAEGVTPAVRPLPLFYGLSQAGRAIAALRRATGWQLAGHGVSVKPAANAPLLDQTIQLRPTGRDAFAGVAESVQSSVPEDPVALGAIWSALPELLNPFPPLRAWPLAMRIVPEVEPDPVLRRMQGNVVFAAAMGFPSVSPTQTEIAAHLKAYPTMGGASAATIVGTDQVTSSFIEGLGILPRLQWSARDASPSAHADVLDQAAPEYAYRGVRYALPAVDGEVVLPPLLLWWLLLHALSIFARYEPGIWRAALDVDASSVAVPLESALEQAMFFVPYAVLCALKGRRVAIGEPF